MIEQPPNTHVAQLNVAKAMDDLESDRLRDFVAALDRVNAVADRSPGFVWRLSDQDDDQSDMLASDDPRLLINLSVWETAEALETFVWQTIHKRVYEKRARWFEKPAQPHFVMWWVALGHIPTIDEGLERLDRLRVKGPTPDAFDWGALASTTLWRTARCA